MGALLGKQKGKDGCESDEEAIAPSEKKPRFVKIKKSLQKFRYSVEDWVYLFLLGTIMALIALGMDYICESLNSFHLWTYEQMDEIDNEGLRYAATYSVWTGYVIILVFLSAVLTRWIAPQAIGSGIPEMKTIFRGVILKEYLTIRTLISKIVGLTLAIGAGLPLGKEGPLVHVSSVVASQLSRLVHSFQGIYENESRSSEMLAAGCAVGVACTFSAPIGGVLFSIEVTSVFFAVRNYWRGFFAAACSATLSRILTPLLKDPDLDLNALFQTRFPTGKAFAMQELPIFALIGFAMGFAGAAFVLLHRKAVLFLRRNHYAKLLFQKYWILYPVLVSFGVATITYPEALGQFMAGRKKFTQTVPDFFDTCIWNNVSYGNVCNTTVTDNWTGLDHQTSVFVSLLTFQIVFFFLCIICSTLPIPAGVFMSVFVLGAAFGRTIGEIMAVILDGEIESGGKMQQLYPGVYAVVGAAAFSGSLTHTVSVTVIVFEVTGQIVLLIPVMISVIIAVAVCSYMQPSIYDSMIRIKHLPYLPDIRHTASIFHSITVDRIMIRRVMYIPRDCTYSHVQSVLTAMPKLRAFPVVDSTTSNALVGSVSRKMLLKLMYEKIGTAARQAEAARRVKEAIGRAHSATILRDSSDDENMKGNGKDNRRLRNRFTIVPVSRDHSVDDDDYDIINSEEVAEKRKQQIQEHIKRTLSNQLGKTTDDKHEINPNPATVTGASTNYTTVQKSLGGLFRSLTSISFHMKSKESKDNEQYDLYGEEREAWERKLLEDKIDFSMILIDSTPFQLVSHSSLFKVHSLFSLLGLSRAYVTERGSLVGVVALKEVREAIEKGQSGLMLRLTLPSGLTQPRQDEESGDTRDFVHDEVRDVYDDDSTDYEDNLQGRLEVVQRTESDDDVLGDSVKNGGTAELSRRDSKRAKWRMDEMTTRARRRTSTNKSNGSALSTIQTPDRPATGTGGENDGAGVDKKNITPTQQTIKGGDTKIDMEESRSSADSGIPQQSLSPSPSPPLIITDEEKNSTKEDIVNDSPTQKKPKRSVKFGVPEDVKIKDQQSISRNRAPTGRPKRSMSLDSTES